MKINYKKELDKLIAKNKENNKEPTLLLHSCCAPCSSHVIEYLANSFKIDILYYNPNIVSKEEYDLRLNEQKRLLSEIDVKKANSIRLIECKFSPEDFLNIAKGLEKEKEGGLRCKKCFQLRLAYTSKVAEEKGYDNFGTTLTISPLKDAKLINDIGIKISENSKTEYIPSDFKKGDGYKRSLELSKKHNLYRQDYCGCIYSKNNK